MNKTLPQLEAEAVKLTADLAAANEAATTAKDENASLAAQLESLKKEAKQRDELLAQKDNALKAKDSEIADLKAKQTTVERKAVNLVSQISHQPVALDAPKNEPTPSLLDQYLAIADPLERGRFYEKNTQAILEELADRS